MSARLHGHTQGQYPGCSYPLNELPAVVAYSPGFFDHTTTQDEFGYAVAELGKFAVASKHVIGWPGAPLAAPWTHNTQTNTKGYGVSGKAHVIPWTYLNTEVFMVFSPKNTLLELSGVWNAMLSDGKKHVYNTSARLSYDLRSPIMKKTVINH